jgi:hypothetical protein
MADLVTLAEVKTHLGLTGTTEHDDNLKMKMQEATDLVLDYMKNYLGTDEERTARYAVIDAWTDLTVPRQVRSAIFRMVANLFGDRGDDPNWTLKMKNGELPENVTMFLKRFKDPALA